MLDFAERDRRYSIIKSKMKAQNIDALVVISSSQITEKGFVKYLSNYRHILYNLVVIFDFVSRMRLSITNLPIDPNPGDPIMAVAFFSLTFFKSSNQISSFMADSRFIR